MYKFFHYLIFELILLLELELEHLNPVENYAQEQELYTQQNKVTQRNTNGIGTKKRSAVLCNQTYAYPAFGN